MISRLDPLRKQRKKSDKSTPNKPDKHRKNSRTECSIDRRMNSRSRFNVCRASVSSEVMRKKVWSTRRQSLPRIRTESCFRNGYLFD